MHTNEAVHATNICVINIAAIFLTYVIINENQRGINLNDRRKRQH